MTEAAYAHMIPLSERFADRANALIRARGLDWSVTQIGARVEFQFRATPPRTGREAEAAFHDGLEKCIHLSLLNRGVMITPFHNMILMCPQTTAGDVDRLVGALAETIDELRNA
jgi:glutamate-1-semialdehyde 2,1-aminomutase